MKTTKLKQPTFSITSKLTGQWLGKNLDNGKYEWMFLSPRESNYQSDFTEREIKQIEDKLSSYTKKATSGN